MKIQMIVLSLLVSSVAIADLENENVVIVSQSAGVLENSSAANRVGKKFSVMGQLVGIGPGVSSNMGLQIGYHLNRNQILQIEAMSGKATAGLDTTGTFNRSAGVHFKHFLGNSFYYRAGVDHVLVNHDVIYSRTTSYGWSGPPQVTAESSGRFEGNMTGATLVIGNQWQWETFSLGCDWVGVTQPFRSHIASQSYTQGDTDAAKSLKDAEDDYLKGTKTHLLRFYLGATF